MPFFPMGTGIQAENDTNTVSGAVPLSPATQVKNRRKRYLDTHPEYFSADLELAGPLALTSLFRD